MTAREFCKKLRSSNYTQDQKNFLYDYFIWFQTGKDKESWKNLKYDEIWEMGIRKFCNNKNTPYSLTDYIISKSV